MSARYPLGGGNPIVARDYVAKAIDVPIDGVLSQASASVADCTKIIISTWVRIPIDYYVSTPGFYVYPLLFFGNIANATFLLGAYSSLTINVYGGNTRQVIEEISTFLKMESPKLAALSS